MTVEHTAKILREGLAFGEGPRWHEGRLHYSDFYRHGVYSMAADGSDAGDLVSSLGQRE